MAIRLENGYDPHSMERSIGRVFITSRKTGKLAAFPRLDKIALRWPAWPRFGPVVGVSMQCPCQIIRREGEKTAIDITHLINHRTLSLPDEKFADCC